MENSLSYTYMYDLCVISVSVIFKQSLLKRVNCRHNSPIWPVSKSGVGGVNMYSCSESL